MTFTHTTAVSTCSICLWLLIMCGISSHGIHDILTCYTRAILFMAVWFMDDFYTYIQTCINIFFTIQNGWESRNIIFFLCLSKLDALFTSLCYYSFHEWEAWMRILLLGCMWFFETSMMIRCNILYDSWCGGCRIGFMKTQIGWVPEIL